MNATEKESGEDHALALMESMLLDDQVSEKTNAVIRKELADQQSQPASDVQSQTPPDPSQTLDTMTALILGSPEFQMH